jgi:hypothetical protein
LSSGAALTQTLPITGDTFKGNYAAYYESHPSASSQIDVAGQFIADGVSGLTGTADVNEFLSGNQVSAVAFTGAYVDGLNGRFTGNLMSGTTGQLAEIFYVLDNATVLMLESDNAPAVGLFQLQDLTVP